MSVCAAFMFFCAIVSLALRMLLVWENGRLNRKYAGTAAPVKDGNDLTAPGEKSHSVGVEDYGPGFRYVL